MPNSVTNIMAGGLSRLAFAVLDKDSNGNSQHEHLAAIGVGAFAGKLPDILDPSLGNPHHRQFFHSIMMLASVDYATKKIFDWESRKQIRVFCKINVLEWDL